MNNKTTIDKTNMNYKYYSKQPLEMVELKSNMLIAKNPHLITSLNWVNNHPLIRK